MEEQISIRKIVMLFLSIYVLLALLIDTFFILPTSVSELLNILDFVICIIFLGDFFLSFFNAKNKIAFLKWGWIDFVSSIPTLDILRWGRLARVIKILRLLRGMKSSKSILEFLFKNRAQGTFISVVLISTVLVTFSSIAILTVEVSPSSNISSPGDAIWWAFVTITTVGYGDLYPVTFEGRVIAAILMTAGVGLFGTFTAFVASYFLVDDQSTINSMDIELSEVKNELRELKSILRANTN